MSRLAIVTATLDAARAADCIRSWTDHASHPIDLYLVEQASGRRAWETIYHDAAGHTVYGYRSREILGVVPAFSVGVQRALEDGAEIIACLHDDLEILQDRWDETVISLFKACPRAGLLGFGGAKGLGAEELYQTAYNPMQLARQGFRSNMRDAEAHGMRSEMAEPVACLDGFSQIGTRTFWEGLRYEYPAGYLAGLDPHAPRPGTNLFAQMQHWGVVHHFYDGMLGCFAKRLGYMTWYLPIKCHHFGGRTAVADPRYHEWARQQLTIQHPNSETVEATGDQAFWTRAHQIGYDQFRDVLPIRT